MPARDTCHGYPDPCTEKNLSGQVCELELNPKTLLSSHVRRTQNPKPLKSVPQNSTFFGPEVPIQGLL